jgi:unsaturated rhamnogalacturonyl hydrolase
MVPVYTCRIRNVKTSAARQNIGEKYRSTVIGSPCFRELGSVALRQEIAPMTSAHQRVVPFAVGLGGGWPAGCAPDEIARRVVRNYVERALSLTSPIHYAEACTWYGALIAARRLGDRALEASLVARFAPLLTPAGAAAVPSRPHVDDRVFGIVPLAIPQYVETGKALADRQWMTTSSDGITTEARYWIDDLYMITSLQVQAFRATGEMKYLERAALTMTAYLDRLQQPNGLFVHTPTSPLFWGRGNGWVAAGMTELLQELPGNDARRARLMSGYARMMAALLRHQSARGGWRQVIDDTSAGNWVELSATGMFTFALVIGVKRGWLPAETYGPAAHAAWLALVGHLDAAGNVAEVCVGTGEAATSGAGHERDSQLRYYFERPRSVGDFHGQAPLLWSASALMDQGPPQT